MENKLDIFCDEKAIKRLQPPERIKGSVGHIARANSALSLWPVNTYKKVWLNISGAWLMNKGVEEPNFVRKRMYENIPSLDEKW